MPHVTAFIGLGSNLADPLSQIMSAYVALHGLADSECIALSGLYKSQAVGPGEQPDYVNAVAQLRTNLDPLTLLDKLQAIEAQHHRERNVRWGPRTLDLDILLFGNQSITHPRLQIPHPQMHVRSFVLAPLADIAPDLVLPDGSSVDERLRQCGKPGLQRLSA